MQISAQELHAQLQAAGADASAPTHTAAELALVDVRGLGAFSESHLLWAVSLPFGQLEHRAAALIPRLATPIVVCDANTGLAERAANRLEALGYAHVATLKGGIAAWQSAGYELYSGVNVPSKAFGEFIETEQHTPAISAAQLAELQASGANHVVLDSRPPAEFTHHSIPGGICCSGAELAYRVQEAAPDPETLVVVNCAGRTRSIIGAQSLINAGVANKVVALENGTMGWRLAGLEVAKGQTDHAPAPTAAGLAAAQQRAEAVARRFGVRTISSDTLTRYRDEREQHSLFIFDVRTEAEYLDSHVADASHAPGGQLVQATDQYVGVRNGRIVLVDEDGVRATMTASWLLQLGWRNVAVLDVTDRREQAASGVSTPTVLGLEAARCDLINPEALAELLAQDSARTSIIDLSSSTDYRKGHIPGAWFATRERIASALLRIPTTDRIILTSNDGTHACFAAPAVQALTSVPVQVLRGGNDLWQQLGHSLTRDDERLADEVDDAWQIPYAKDRSDGLSPEDGMRAYLSWEVELTRQIERDDTISFRQFPAPA